MTVSAWPQCTRNNCGEGNFFARGHVFDACCTVVFFVVTLADDDEIPDEKKQGGHLEFHCKKLVVIDGGRVVGQMNPCHASFAELFEEMHFLALLVCVAHQCVHSHGAWLHHPLSLEAWHHLGGSMLS